MKVIQTSGKRKTAIARATLKKGDGRVRVNGKLLDVWAPKLAREKIFEPLKLVKYTDVNINVNVNGGGILSQAEASRLAISRALLQHNESFKKVFLSYDRNLLVADIRRKEAVKPNSHSKARSKRQKSYR